MGKSIARATVERLFAGGAITGTQPVSRGGALPNGSPASVNSNIPAVENAILAALGLSSTYGAEAGSGTALSINTGSQTINATNGFHDPSGAYVFTSSTFAIGNGNTLTINGSASDYVVIDITGNSTDKLDGALTLTGGITPDQVLINFIALGGNVQGAANGATLQGTFLIPNIGVQLNSLVIDGHLFGGEAEHNFQFVSNAGIEQQTSTPSPVPEPATILLLGSGLVATVSRFRRRRSTRDTSQ
jgi:PEP-CTERM motif